VVDIISAKHTASSHVLFAEVVQVIAGIVTRLYVRYESDAKLMTIMASDVERNLIDAISCPFLLGLCNQLTFDGSHGIQVYWCQNWRHLT